MNRKVRAEIWHGNHNKFLVVANGELFSRKRIKDLSKEFNLDGIIFTKTKTPFEMKFFNPDGSPDNCGNGLRVTAKFISNKLKINKGELLSLKMRSTFKVSQKESQIIIRDMQIKKKGVFTVAGVSHKLLLVKDFERAKKLAPLLRKSLNLNITLVKKLSKDIFAQTFEVGVEDFTAACGTGAIAASLASGSTNIFMPGGLLKVKKRNNEISLSGQTQFVKEVIL